MYTIAAVLILSSFSQFPPSGYPSDLAEAIATADAVAIAEFVSYAGEYRANVVTVDENGNITPTEDSGRVDRYLFRPRLVVKGHLNNPFTTILFSGRTTPYGPELVPEGTCYLMILHKPFGPSRLVWAGGRTCYVAESPEQWEMGSFRVMPELPAQNYTSVGSTPVQHVGGVLVQAYERVQNPEYIRLLENSIPRDRALLFVLPDYVEFYSTVLEPRLLRAAGDDPERKSRVLRASAIVTGDPGYLRFWEFMNNFDATADPTALVWFEIGLFKPGDFQKLINLARSARTAAVRAGAIRALIHRASEEQKDIFISLLGDANQQVRVAALLWLDQIQTDRRYKVKRADRDTITNEDELIRYWQGR